MIRVDYEEAGHKYWVNGERVPSVTEIIGQVTPKDALGWWGMRVGMAATVTMMRDVPWAQIANANEPAHIINPRELPEAEQFFTKADHRKQKPRSYVEAWTVDNKRSVNHLLDEAADRGIDVHLALERLSVGDVVSPSEFPVDQRGFVAGLMAWYLEQEPEFVANELIVGSERHGFAGRFDTVVRYPGRFTEDESRPLNVMTDLKTSRAVYMSHLLQLPLYRVAYEEMGFGALHGPLDRLEVLHLGADGTYRLVPSMVTDETVLAMVTFARRLRAETSRHADLPGTLIDDPKNRRR